jgi:hypothetical protein
VTIFAPGSSAVGVSSAAIFGTRSKPHLLRCPLRQREDRSKLVDIELILGVCIACIESESLLVCHLCGGFQLFGMRNTGAMFPFEMGTPTLRNWRKQPSARRPQAARIGRPFMTFCRGARTAIMRGALVLGNGQRTCGPCQHGLWKGTKPRMRKWA